LSVFKRGSSVLKAALSVLKRFAGAHAKPDPLSGTTKVRRRFLLVFWKCQRLLKKARQACLQVPGAVCIDPAGPPARRADLRGAPAPAERPARPSGA